MYHGIPRRNQYPCGQARLRCSTPPARRPARPVRLKPVPRKCPLLADQSRSVKLAVLHRRSFLNQPNSRNYRVSCSRKRNPALGCQSAGHAMGRKNDQLNRKSAAVRSEASTRPVRVTEISVAPSPLVSTVSTPPETEASLLPVAVKAAEPR